MRVTIYCGIPGSGKTTAIEKRHHPANLLGVCSADHFFEDDQGSYRFDPSKLPEAHASCLRKFIALVATGQGLHPNDEVEIVVDNTNTTVAEVAPYAAIAQAFGADLQIVTLQCDPSLAATRNIHGVPTPALHAMAARLATRDLPPWWPHTVEVVS